MHLSLIPVCCVLILNLQLSFSHPITTGLSDTDMDIFKVLLHKLEESVSLQSEVDQRVPVDQDRVAAEEATEEEQQQQQQSQTGLDEAAIREFFSAKNLKNVRNEALRRSSGCFGRRMDRIGSMSSLGCNTVGKYNVK